jgi:hypothetical protein
MAYATISLLVLAVIFGGALLGMFLRARLPQLHLDNETKDVVRLGVGLIGTLAALIVGLMIASAKIAGADRIGGPGPWGNRANVTPLDERYRCCEVAQLDLGAMTYIRLCGCQVLASTPESQVREIVAGLRCVREASEVQSLSSLRDKPRGPVRWFELPRAGPCAPWVASSSTAGAEPRRERQDA